MAKPHRLSASPMHDSDKFKHVLLSTPLLGLVIAILTWPFSSVVPGPGVDPSWVAGLYMATARGMNAGAEIVFSYGPLGFLDFPSLYDVWLGRLAFGWSLGVQMALCASLLWVARRAFGLIFGVVITVFAAALPFTDPILIVGTVVGITALLGNWDRRAYLMFAIGAGALVGLELLTSLRAGPALAVMAIAVLLGLPERRRNLLAFAGALTLVFLALWFDAGQGIGNIEDYAVNAAGVVRGYSAAMVFVEPGASWRLPAFSLAVAMLVVLYVMAVRRERTARKIALGAMLVAVGFMTFKHSAVRPSAGNAAVFLAAMLAIGLALAPYVRRSVAIGLIGVLLGLAMASNWYLLKYRLDLEQRATSFTDQLTTMVVPGRAEDVQTEGRIGMQALYGLDRQELALLETGNVHVAPWEAGAAWAYGLDWNPLPVFQQYSAYTEDLDKLNAAKLDSQTAPNLILWQNAPVVDPGLAAAVNFPGAIDARWPAFESPAQMVRMLCRYRALHWTERWAILGRVDDRCRDERLLGTIEADDAQIVRFPRTRRDEVLLVRVYGLAVHGAERLRALFFRATNRHVTLDTTSWNIVGETAANGLLLRIPPKSDFPGQFSLNSGARRVAFTRVPGFSVENSTPLRLEFRAMPIDRLAEQ